MNGIGDTGATGASRATGALAGRRTALHRLVGASAALLVPAFAGSVHAQAAAPAGTLPPVRRLVTLSGAITEVVYALGAQKLLVATDTTSLYPEAAARTPKVGYLRQLSSEGLLALRPDAVIGSSDAGPPVVLEQLRAAGVRVELIASTHDLAEVLTKVDTVGRAIGMRAEAQQLAEGLRQSWAAVQAEVAAARQRPRALFILSHGGSPMVAGRGTAADALMTMAGAQNVVQAFEGYRPLTAEAMAAAAPQVIVNSTQGIEALGGVDAFWRRPELALTPAFQRRALASMEASLLLGFGPRLPQAVRELHRQMLQQVA